MPGRSRVSLVLAALTLVAFAAPPAAADWRDARSMAELVGHLDDWLDRHSGYPRKPGRLKVRQVTPTRAEMLHGTAARHGRLRGLYDPEMRVIYLVTPFSARAAADVSVLLHELVHHRQHGARHWYCFGAQEPEAYDLQAAWLAEQGEALPVNRIAVVLSAGCTPRDIHPD